MISLIKEVTSPSISLEEGDTVIWKDKRYTITDTEKLMGEDIDTGELKELTKDNLFKEETQCIPITFNMI